MLGTGLGSETQPGKVSFGWGGQDKLPRGGTGKKVGHRAHRVLGETGQGERATQTGTQQPIPSCDPPLRALTLVLQRMDTTQTRRLLSKLLARWVLEFRIFQVLERKFRARIVYCVSPPGTCGNLVLREVHFRSKVCRHPRSAGLSPMSLQVRFCRPVNLASRHLGILELGTRENAPILSTACGSPHPSRLCRKGACPQASPALLPSRLRGTREETGWLARRRL